MEMTFGSNYYIPILRSRPGEIKAFGMLDNSVRQRLTPCFELCRSIFLPKENKKTRKLFTAEEALTVIFSKLKMAIREQPFLLDTIHINKDYNAALANNLWSYVSNIAQEQPLKIIPVTGFHRGKDYQLQVSQACKQFEMGACIRLYPEDLNRPHIKEEIQKLIGILQLSQESIDIILDLKLINHLSPRTEVIINKLPVLEQWRTVSVAGGSFPKDLSGPELSEIRIHTLERLEWKKWVGEVYLSPGKYLRVPAFSDYTIQHAIYYDPVQYAPSASVRYTANESWLVFRGQKLNKKNGAFADQYTAHAQILVNRDDYSGENFSAGDAFVMQRSKDEKHTGNFEQWLAASINHHITYVVDQISKLDKKAKTVTVIPSVIHQKEMKTK